MSDGGRTDRTTASTESEVGRREFDALAGVVEGGVVRTDADGVVLEATDAFTAESGRSRGAVVGEPLSSVFGAPSAERVDETRTRLLDRLAADAPGGNSDVEATAELPVHVETPAGEQRPRELHLRAVHGDGEPRGVVGVLRDGGETRAALAEHEHVMRAVYNVSADDSLSFEERIGEMLAVVREAVGTSYATLSRVDGSDYHFDVVDTDQDGRTDIEAGETVPLDQTNCERVVETEQTVVFRDLDEQAPELASRDGNTALGLSCYLGAPVVVDDEVQGTFCFYGTEAREAGFDEWEVALVGFVAQWVEYELTQRRTYERLERTTAERREAEQRYRTLVEHFPNGVVALVNHDLEYATVGGSPMAPGMESTESIQGKTIREAIPEAVADVLEPKYRAALNGESSTFEQAIGTRIARVHIFPVRDDDGEVVAAMGMSQDVTEQTERKRELETYETIVETVNDGIYVVDDKLRYETVNDAFCDLTGYSRDELLGEHARFVVDEATLERAGEIRASAGDDETPSIETTIETADGETVPVEVTFSRLEQDGERKRVGVVRDVTERRERRRRLAESERKYRTLVEHFPNGAVGLFDEDLEYTAIGGEMLDDLDVSTAERVGRSVHDIYSDEIASEVEPYFLAALDGEYQSFDIEYRGRHVSGQTLPVRDAEGDVDAGMLVVQDVTEQREQRRRLAESEQRYRALVENMPNGGVGVFDEDLRYTLVDGTMWDTIDIDADELEGETIWAALPEDTLADVEPVFRAALDGEPGSVLSTLGGRTYRVWATPLRDAEGNVTAGQSIALDVTEQQERERELERTLDLLERTERIADVGGWEIDPETMGVFWSDHLFDILGVDGDEEPPLDEALDVYHEDDRGLVEDAVQGALEDGEAFDLEVRFRRSSGELRWLHLQGSPESVDGEVVSLRGAAQDVTEQRERQRELEAAKDQMEAAAEAGAVGTWQWHIPEDRFVADAALARLFGVDPERARDGVALDEIVASIHEDDRDQVEAAIDRAVQQCGDYEEEYRVYDADGDVRWVGARGHVECEEGEDGEPVPVSFPGAITDITEQREYERQLEAQSQRLAALNQLNDVVHGVTEAVIDQPRRSEIERIACERLAESDSYEFAWIAEPDSRDDEVAVRAQAGTGDYLDEVVLSLDPDEPAGEGPTARALRTGEMQTVRDVQSDPRYEPWRDLAEAYGFQSSAAIPIRFENTTFGVLNVYADRVDAFRKEERTVVEHLGRLLGHAIAATERKQALLSDTLVELEVHVENMQADLDLDAAPSSPVVLERAIPVDDTDFLVYGTAPTAELEALESMVESVPSWQSLTTIGATSEGTRFELAVSDPPLMSVVASVGGSIGRVRIEGGGFEMTVHLPQDVDVRAIVERMRAQYSNTEIVARRQVERDSGQLERFADVWANELTDRQRTVVETAFFAGFFEWPRATSGEDVADRLGISGATFSQHLRAAQQKLFAGLVGADPDSTDFTN